MRRLINLFMWGYQSHFYWEVEDTARTVLQAIAPTIEPRALLVGVRSPDKADGHPVCVQPEDEDWDPTIFFGCFARANNIYRDHPDQRIFYGDEPRMRDKPENIRRKSALQAVQEVISKYDDEHDTKSFCGWPGKVEGYYVIPVLQISKTQIDAYPQLPSTLKVDDWESPLSFIEAVIECLLADSTMALGAKEPGRFMLGARADVPAVLRKAAERFCSVITLATKDIFFRETFDSLNVISSLPYEGSETIGEIVFVPPSSRDVKIQVQFRNAVPLSRHRLARKVIEMSTQSLSCICHGSDGITGLGALVSTEGEVCRVVFTGNYAWDFFYKGTLQMKSAFGVPKLPIPRLNFEQFCSTARRIFTDFREEDGRRLWSFIETSMEQRHGTMLVFSESAEQEGERLRNQSIGIEPIPITPELVSRLTGIDGAILISPNGVCHAIGVILDGIATDQGDSSRGARYNSAIRYLVSFTAATMCLVVSEDGYVDMLPKLRPQVRKTDVDAQIQALKTRGIQDFHKPFNWLDKHRFYLTEAQCEIVNAEIARIYSAPMEVGDIRFTITPFEPNPAMNDSYYLPAP